MPMLPPLPLPLLAALAALAASDGGRGDSSVVPLLVRHEALFDRAGVKGPRRLAVAAAG